MQKVWFRMFDGGYPDGFGYDVNNGQSLEKLYFGSINSMGNLMGTAIFTKVSLMQALKEILVARAPNNVRTLNYLSEYDSGGESSYFDRIDSIDSDYFF